MMENKSIASRWSDKTQQPKPEPKPEPTVTNPIVVSPVESNNANPVRHQYRQTILNGLKGESYV